MVRTARRWILLVRIFGIETHSAFIDWRVEVLQARGRRLDARATRLEMRSRELSR